MPLSNEERYNIVTSHTKLGISVDRLSKVHHVTTHTIYAILKRYNDTGDHKKLTGSGHHTKFQCDIDKIISRIAHGIQGTSYRRISYHVGPFTPNNHIAWTTVRNHMNRMGFKLYHEGFDLPLSDDLKRDRVNYCINHINDDITNDIHLDEKHFVMNDTGQYYYCTPDSIKYHGHTRLVNNTNCCVKVLGAICIGASPLIVTYTGHMNSNKFIERLEKDIKPYLALHPGKTIVMDKAPWHKSDATATYMRDNHITWHEDYPPKSPDLNPIEQFWSSLVDSVKKSMPTNHKQLKQAIKTAVNVTPQREIDATIRHRKVNMQKIIETNGNRVH